MGERRTGTRRGELLRARMKGSTCCVGVGGALAYGLVCGIILADALVRAIAGYTMLCMFVDGST